MTSFDQEAQAAYDEPFSIQALLVVAAAREWAAAIWGNNERLPVEFMDELPTISVNTEEERRRRSLLDAVHDLEHRGQPTPRPPTLFDPPA